MAKRLMLLVAVAAIVLPATWARAGDMWLGAGANFQWDNYNTPVLMSDGLDAELVPSVFGGPRLGGEIQWGLTKNFVLSLSVDFNFFKYNVFPYPGGPAEAEAPSIDATFFTFGGLIGAKYYLRTPAALKAVPYVSLDVGGYLSKGSGDYEYEDGKYLQNEENVDFKKDQISAQMDMIAGLAAPVVVQLAIGVEFWAADSFAIGADLLGIRFAYAAANVEDIKCTRPDEIAGDPAFNDAACNDYSSMKFTGEASYLNLTVYSGLTLTFNLSAGPKDKPVAEESEESWGQQEQTPEEQGWGTGGGWTSTPTPAPNPQPAPVPAPAPAPAPAAPGSGSWGNDASPPPPPPPPPGY